MTRIPPLLIALPCWVAMALCASLSACNQGQVNTASTRAVISADGGYEAASKAGEDAVKLGKLDRRTYQALDRQAYSALIALRLARSAGNAPDVAAATADLSLAVVAIYNAVKGN